jgi:hypothetical protein
MYVFIPYIHQLLCRSTSPGPHISTDLELDEASSAALVRMTVGCPQQTELTFRRL